MNRPPKIIHRIYFPEFKPFYDPFEHYLDTWREKMPGYEIMKWNSSNLDVNANEWTRTAWENKSPVFLSEYFRWKLLQEYGGIYLDADCEVINGDILDRLFAELQESQVYDVFFGVEEQGNGHPTAQTFAAKKGAELVDFMVDLYENRLTPLWPWRERRGLIGPQLLGLYFLGHGINVADDGLFKGLVEPTITRRAKVYPQEYFSPKFSLLGTSLNYDEKKTCVYHMFANSNVDFSKDRRRDTAREQALRFDEYREYLKTSLEFPRTYDAHCFSLGIGKLEGEVIVHTEGDGVLFFGPYCTLPKGHYEARLICSERPTRGKMTLTVTADSGGKRLGARSINARVPLQGAPSVEFEISAEEEHNVEVVLGVVGIDRMALDRIEIHRTDRDAPNDGRPGLVGKGLKILHRIYFGFDGKPDQFKGYLETWEEKLPDFTIMHWNASNLPMDSCAYVKRLYAERDHAFLTDYFRWYVLREYGGSYLDADVEIVDGDGFRSVIEDLSVAENYDAVIGIDERTGGWYTAHSMASKPHSEIAEFMCRLYENFGAFAAWRKRGFYFWAPQLTALYFADNGHNVGGMGTTPHLVEPKIVQGVKIYPQDWFSPLAPTGEPTMPFRISGLTGNTCLCHHFACSWHDDESIYLDHSRQSGGQSGVRLAEIVKKRKVQRFSASTEILGTKVGRRTSDGIRTDGTAGCLVFGPYVTLMPGRYSAYFVFDDVRRFEGTIDVVCDEAREKLADRGLSPRALRDGSVRVPFEVSSYKPSIEFRVFATKRSSYRLREIVVICDGLEALDRGEARPLTIGETSFDHVEAVTVGCGRREGSAIATTGVAGHLFFGPYMTLPPGSYELLLAFAEGGEPKGLTVDVVGDAGKTFLLNPASIDRLMRKGIAVVEFAIGRVAENIEFRLHVEAGTRARLEHLILVRHEEGVSAVDRLAAASARRSVAA